MKPTLLEIRRVEALEKLAKELAELYKRLDEIEAKLDKALSEKEGTKPGVKADKVK